MLPQGLIEAAASLSQKLRERAQIITTVESCTGGLVGASITAIPGSSDIYPGGFITYSNGLKQRMVGVSLDTLKAHGAVSAQTAIEMAMGGMRQTNADWSISITGIAGPGGGSDEKPVGTVWICGASSGTQDCRRFVFPGDRDQVRQRAARSSMQLAIQSLGGVATRLEHEAERFDA